MPPSDDRFKLLLYWVGRLMSSNDCGDAMGYVQAERELKRMGITVVHQNPIPAEVRDQPPPTHNQSRPIWELVIEDMKQRDQVGRERYGTPLQAHNGRDALVDAYQEALDLTVCLRQAIEERKS